MATPTPIVVLVDSVAPPPLGVGGIFALNASATLSLASTVGLNQLRWELTSIPSASACAIGTPTPTITTSPASSQSSIGPFDKVGTYICKATPDNDPNRSVAFSIAVLTENLGLRIPGLGEQTQFHSSRFWHPTLEASINAIEALASGSAGVGSVTYKTFVINQAADLSVLAPGVMMFTRSQTLPSNARLLGYEVMSIGAVGFDNGGGGTTYVVEIGKSTPSDVAAAVNVKFPLVGFPKAGAAGVRGYAGSSVGGTVNVTLTSNADLNTAITGNIQVVVYYAPVTVV